jgi:NodT family efflux transporter outer membrane factor (OMF) lipoprotein
MLLVLPSCGLPVLRHADAPPDLPTAYKPGGPGPDQPADSHAENCWENSSQLGIEEFFNDPILTALIQQALADNRELKILDEEIQIARNEVLARQGAYLPFVTAGAGMGLEKSSRFTRNGAVDSQLNIVPGEPFPNPLPDYLGALNVFWQVDIWRQLRNARDAARARFVAAVEKRNYFVTRLVAEIAENYYGLVALDKRLETLDKTIELQEASLKMAKAKKEAGRGTELAVQRFQAEVHKNQSEKLVVNQEIIQSENRINFLLNRFPQPVERIPAKSLDLAGFLDLTMHTLSLGVPSQLLENRPDIRQAERELEAAGLDVRVARAKFFPTLILTGSVGYEAFNTTYLFNPEAFVATAAGQLVAPLINKKAIQAEYLSANARQLETVYNYQRVILNAFTEVINRMSMVRNFSNSIEIKKGQLKSLELSVEAATNLFQNARAEYIEVLFAQRDLMDARMVVIETKKEQLSAIVNTYQALGGGNLLAGSIPEAPPLHRWHPVRWLIEHCTNAEHEQPQEVMDAGHPPMPGLPPLPGPPMPSTPAVH